MAISLRFYTDDTLTTPATSTAIGHLVDGSNDPQDFVFYLGSTESANKFRKQSNPGVDNLIVSVENVTPLWQAAAAYVVNDTARTTSKNGYRYKVQSITGGGVSGGSEPVWPTTVGDTVVDGEVTWVNDQKLHENTEVKLATSSAGLGAATPGASISISSEIQGGAANSVPIHFRVDDATEFIDQESELKISVLGVVESPI